MYLFSVSKNTIGMMLNLLPSITAAAEIPVIHKALNTARPKAMAQLTERSDYNIRGLVLSTDVSYKAVVELLDDECKLVNWSKLPRDLPRACFAKCVFNGHVQNGAEQPRYVLVGHFLSLRVVKFKGPILV
ncbi:hypothetical protein CAPTEDRAFT_186524 [Capitella teleta]|uniref:Uncharacterized protein n=1 Tax=Capitella teleta TaxID=283909 RepID=R7V1W5_CAPTE|nr:hypothetical protein CAPTEDRAFT_186524 [Capitella teleta]|eukprot:ELU12838.1 hypothetical protein CAPTEDRAFT_186524 [Capitella teleta]